MTAVAECDPFLGAVRIRKKTAISQSLKITNSCANKNIPNAKGAITVANAANSCRGQSMRASPTRIKALKQLGPSSLGMR